jgi:prepilin-type N-terminal cleavage/methylation domain-containing protein
LYLPTARRNKHSPGFTLVEALVALTVAGISLAAIANLSNETLRSSLYVDRHLAVVETAQQIIAGFPGRGQLVDGALNGEAAGLGWSLAVAPFDANFVSPGPSASWAPKKLVLTVQGPSGTRLTIETIRLVEIRAP